MKIPPKIDEALIASAEVDEKLIEAAGDRAEALVAAGGFLPLSTSDIVQTGAAFEIDLLVPEELKTGDNRIFKADSLTARDFPITLYWQERTAPGHDGSVIVGRIDGAERLTASEDAPTTTVYLEDGSTVEGSTEPPKQGWGRAYGVFDVGPYGQEAERLVRGGFLRGVSVDLDQFVGTAKKDPVLELAEGDEIDISDNGDEVIKSEAIEIDEARIIAATLTGKPAFQECIIRISEPEFEVMEDSLIIDDGEYEESSDDLEDTLSVMIASAAPVVPPRDWFNNPKLKKPTPLTVEDDGRVFGHIAAWETNHIGMAGRIKPPRSRSNYAYFKHGVIRTDDGTDVAVGQLTLAGGHAPTTFNARDAVKHYDDTASAVVDVTIGEDNYGIWVAGALRPEVTASQVRALRASAPSGDWRPFGNKLELVAACCVNVPGFPIARAMVAGGQIQALVAAGARSLAELRDPVSELEKRLSAIEHKEFSARMATISDRMNPVVAARDEALVASARASKRRLLGPSLAEQREEQKNRLNGLI